MNVANLKREEAHREKQTKIDLKIPNLSEKFQNFQELRKMTSSKKIIPFDHFYYLFGCKEKMGKEEYLMRVGDNGDFVPDSSPVSIFANA